MRRIEVSAGDIFDLVQTFSSLGAFPIVID